MTMGVAKSINVVLKDARDLPILWLVAELRNLLQKWFANHKQQALSMTNELTTWTEGKLRNDIIYHQHMKLKQLT